jgi:hypothetical protein
MFTFSMSKGNERTQMPEDTCVTAKYRIEPTDGSLLQIVGSGELGTSPLFGS